MEGLLETKVEEPCWPTSETGRLVEHTRAGGQRLVITVLAVEAEAPAEEMAAVESVWEMTSLLL